MNVIYILSTDCTMRECWKVYERDKFSGANDECKGLSRVTAVIVVDKLDP